jgi:hypothetical protein
VCVCVYSLIFVPYVIITVTLSTYKSLETLPFIFRR